MQAILFDLDGTLLPMDMEAFTAGYFSLLAKKAAPRGYEPEALIRGIWKSTRAMLQNDGSRSNKDCFWAAFAQCFGERVYDDVALFDSFYKEEFREAVVFTSPAPDKARAALRLARARAERVVLATNPIFPKAGVETRLRWLGLEIGEFDYVSSYENASFCKPDARYYQQLVSKLALRAQDCLMIGNDVQEDILAAERAGIRGYLVRDCAINRSGAAVSLAGSFDELLRYLEELGE